MQNKLPFYTILIAILLTLFAVLSFSSKSNKDKAVTSSAVKKDQLPQIVKGVDLKKKYDFAGEIIPIENFDVRERLDRELTVNSYWHSSTLLNIKNAYKFFPVIEPILAAHGIPDDFKYLMVAESNFRNEVSIAGAKGFWQFMRPTAQYYKLEINSEVDERYNIEKATEAACKYISSYYKQFNSWTLSAAAYNMGGPNLAKEMKLQKESTFFDLNLNQETNRYIFRLVAIKEVLKNPKKFGFYIYEEDAYQPLTDYDIVKINTPIESLADFAHKYGTTYRFLKVYNPWLISSRLSNPSRKTYEIKIPKQRF